MESAATPGGYADSIDSLSPRSRGGESWDETFPSGTATAAQPQSGGGAKLRLMCSYGGQIVPRPHDRTLCYLGGETRIVVLDRHANLSDLQSRLARYVGGRNFCLKYQLPSEDLDSLISVTTDEDLENMIEEYDRVAAGSGSAKPLRLRLFIFPSKPESTGTASSIGSLIDDSKSETWFVDALNNAMLGRGRSSADSVNCLLGIDESKASTVNQDSEIVGKIMGGSRQEIHSVPDSPMLGTFSSFGSASSTPSLSNLPPIRVRSDDVAPDRRTIGVGLEEPFAQISFSDQKPLQQQQSQQQVDIEGLNSGLLHHPPPPSQLINIVPMAENPVISKIIPTDDDKPDHIFRKSSPLHPQLQQQQQQQLQNQSPKPVGALDLSGTADGVTARYVLALSQFPCFLGRCNLFILMRMPRSGFYQERLPPVAAAATSDPNQVNEKGYLLQQQAISLPVQALEQIQPQQQPSQQQFLQASPHLLHHAGGTMLPIGHYYQPQLLQDPHAYNPQIPMYFLPVRQNAAMPVLPTGSGPAKQELATGSIYSAASAAPPQLSHQFVGYPSMHHSRPQSSPAYAYEQIYYTTTAAAPTSASTLPPQYQQPADPKQGKAS